MSDPDERRAAIEHTFEIMNARQLSNLANNGMRDANQLLQNIGDVMSSPGFQRGIRNHDAPTDVRMLMKSLPSLASGDANNVLEVAYFLLRLSQAVGLTWSARATAARTKCNGANAFTSVGVFGADCDSEEKWTSSCKDVLTKIDPNYQSSISEMVSVSRDSPMKGRFRFASTRDYVEKVFGVHEWVCKQLCAGTEPDVGCTARVKAQLLRRSLPANYRTHVDTCLASVPQAAVTFEMVCTTVTNLERTAAHAAVASVSAVGTGPGAALSGLAAASHVMAVGADCYQCGLPGHVIADCPKTVCFKCNGTGHMASGCPSSGGGSRARSPDGRRDRSSRSPSRGRGRSRDRDRARDRGRGRSPGRDRDRYRGRARSRSRDRGRVPAQDWTPRVCPRCKIVCGPLKDCPKYPGCPRCGSKNHLVRNCKSERLN